MRLDAIQPGDIVRCNVRGNIFYGEVEQVGIGEVRIDPRRVNGGRATERTVTARQVIAHYRASGTTRRAARTEHYDRLGAA